MRTPDAVGVHSDCLHVFQNEISFAPEARPLHVRVSGSTEPTEGAWSPAYLALMRMQDCATSDPDSGHFHLEA